MDNMILIDLETGGFEVESGIYEVALMVIEDGQPVEKLQLGNVKDEALIERGYGAGYYECSNDNELKGKFIEVLNKYQYPLVAHNGSFDRKFLLHYEWIDENYPFYDSLRAIKLVNSKLFSYSLSHLMEYLEYDKNQSHTAIDDVEILYNIIKYFKPTTWLPIGTLSKSNSQYKNYSNYTFEQVKNIFNGKTVVFTGKGIHARKYLIQLAIKCGAVVSNSVTKKTEILVVGEDSGKKVQQANELGCEIMTMSEFYELVTGVEIEEVYEAPKKESKTTENSKQTIVTGKIVALTRMKESIKEKVAQIITDLGGIPSKTFRANTAQLLIYQSNRAEEDILEKAKANNVEIMTLGKFNKLIEEYL